MKKLRLLHFLLLALLVWPGKIWAATYEIDTAHSSVGFKIKHLVSTVKGSFGSFSGTIEYDESALSGSVAATIQAASIDTNNAKRDDHLRTPDFFDAEQFPEIMFVGKTEDGKQATGKLTMHGVTKEIQLGIAFNGVATDPWGGQRAGFSAEAVINRKDFGMEYNKVLDQGGLLLGDRVEIEIEIEAVLKSS